MLMRDKNSMRVSWVDNEQRMWTMDSSSAMKPNNNGEIMATKKPKPIMFRDGEIVKLRPQTYYDSNVVKQEEKLLKLGQTFLTREQAIQKLKSLRARKVESYSFKNDRYDIYRVKGQLVGLRNIARQKFDNRYAVSRHVQTMYRLEVLK
jgi:hypothetical protein